MQGSKLFLSLVTLGEVTSQDESTCPKCEKELANRHSLFRHKKNCSNGSYMTNQLGIRRPMVPVASENFSLDETISGFVKKSDETGH